MAPPMAYGIVPSGAALVVGMMVQLAWAEAPRPSEPVPSTALTPLKSGGWMKKALDAGLPWASTGLIVTRKSVT